MAIDAYRVAAFADITVLSDFNKKADLSKYGNDEDKVKEAIDLVKKASENLTKALEKSKLISSQRYNLLFLNQVFSGLLADYKKAEDILSNHVNLEYTDSINIAKLIIQLNNNSDILREIRKVQNIYNTLTQGAIIRANSIFDILDPSGNEIKANDPEDKQIKSIAHSISKAPKKIEELVAKQALFATLFIHAEKKDNKSKHGDNSDKVMRAIKDLQDTLKNYSDVSKVSVFIPGVSSSQGNKDIINTFIRAFKSGDAERERAINFSESVIIKQQRMQNVKNMLESLINKPSAYKKTTFVVDIDKDGNLDNGLTIADLRKVEGYKRTENGKTIGDLLGHISPAVQNKTGVLKGIVDAYAKQLHLMIKEVIDESSKALVEMQNASYKKNNAADCISVIIRRVFDVLEDAFLLSRKR